MPITMPVRPPLFTGEKLYAEHRESLNVKIIKNLGTIELLFTVTLLSLNVFFIIEGTLAVWQTVGGKYNHER